MRPIELRMKAFGSYAEETVLPFRDLKNGLYLITGDTGAGKTTIFDAIMFALYGKASGTNRDVSMLHCDHVSKKEPTEVNFTFFQGDRAYTVVRSLKFRKNRETGDYSDGGTHEAEITGTDMRPISGASNVTKKCTEILGLDANQFRKIIMLAQGEFKEFLNSDSEGRGLILGKLLDTKEYRRYQTLIVKLRDELKKRRGAKNEELSILMSNSFVAPEDEREAKKEATWRLSAYKRGTGKDERHLPWPKKEAKRKIRGQRPRLRMLFAS